MASTSIDTSLTTPHTMVVPGAVPPLASGDRLSADEFLRRYEAMPFDVRAELVDGVAYMFMTVSADHGEPHFILNGLLFHYAAVTPGTVGGDNITLRLDLKNVPQPDGYLRIKAAAGGQAKVESGYVVGAPEFVCEVAASSASYDLREKLEAYEKNGVREYIVWRVWDKAIDLFALEDGKFKPLATGDDGIHRSRVFPGLWLDCGAIVAGDVARALAVMQQGVADEAHQVFADELQRKLTAAESKA